MLRFSEHTAAVKAIAWSPHQRGLLASGGGTADRCIRFWNTTMNTHLSCIDTGSQVYYIYTYAHYSHSIMTNMLLFFIIWFRALVCSFFGFRDSRLGYKFMG